MRVTRRRCLELASLAETYGDTFAPALACWIETFAHEPADAWTVLRPVSGAEPNASVAVAWRRLVEGWRKAPDEKPRHLQLVEEVLTHAATTPVSSGFLRAAGLAKLDQEPIAGHMAALYAANETPHATRQFLEAWTILAPSTEKVRRTLVKSILLPAAHVRNAEVFDAVREYASLLKGLSSDRRKAVQEAMRSTAQELQRTNELEEKLEALGLRRRRGPFSFGGKEDV